MEIIGSQTNLESVSYDLTKVPDGWDQNLLYSLFATGRATFDNEKYDVVAMNRGINPDGNLDMEMLANYEQVGQYIEGRQGQPLVTVQHVYEGSRLLRIDANVGVIANEDKITGVFTDSNKRRTAGIKLQAPYCDIEGDASGPDFRIGAVKPIDADVLPLANNELIIGKQGGGYPIENYEYRQYVAAGEDIITWLNECFDSTRSKYEVFLGLREALKYHEAISYILKPPFTEMFDREIRILNSIAAILRRSQTMVSLHQKAMDGEVANASLDLFRVTSEAGELGYRIPITRDSESIRVTAEITNPHGIDARLQAIKYRFGRLGITDLSI